MRRFLRWPAGEDGAISVEFALVAPLLFLLLIGILELAMSQFLGSLIESAVLEASRFGATGYTPASVSRDDVIRDRINDWAMGLIDPADITIDTKTYPNFDSVGKPEPYDDLDLSGGWDAGEPFVDINGNGTWDADMGAAGLGGPGDIVLYNVGYQWGMLTGLLKPIIGNNILFTSTVAVRNEPY